jgi:hypothetical protein
MLLINNLLLSRNKVRHLPFQTPRSRYLAEKKRLDLFRCPPRLATPGRNPPLLVDFGHSRPLAFWSAVRQLTDCTPKRTAS